MFEELEIVELAHNIKKHNLKRGERGTIVEIYKDGEAYEVEFVAPNGKTIALLTLMPNELHSTMNKAEYSFHVKPVYVSTVSKRTFIIHAKAMRGFNTKSKADTEKFYYPPATL